MKVFKYPRGTKPTKELIVSLIGLHSDEKSRVSQLNSYYQNQNQILYRTMNDESKPNNKLVHGYASYITDMATGYFLGKPVSYTSSDSQLVGYIQDLGRNNFEHDVNTTLAKLASIAGYSYLLFYIDEFGNLKYKPLPTEEVIFVTDNTVEERPMFAIRYWTTTNPRVNTVEIYDRENVSVYELEFSTSTDWKLVHSYQHYLGTVPVVRHLNNDEMIGDFERVKSLIDAYDKTQSDSANDFEYFTNAYLGVYGAVVTTETAQNMKENRILNFPNENSRAEFLTKDINENNLEIYKTRLQEDIHKFSLVPAMSDEKFAGNVSGEAMKYKLMGLENMTAIKEQKFRRAMAYRLLIISNYLAVKMNVQFNINDVDVQFTRNIPKNELELSNMVKNLVGIVSEETSLSLLPFVDDVQRELDRKGAEAQFNANPFGV